MNPIIEKHPITNAEWEVMRTVWSKETATSRDIVEVLKPKMDWEPATIKTLMGRLVKKGYLKTSVDGNRYHYSAIVSEPECLEAEVDKLLDQICPTKVVNLLDYLIDRCALSYEDMAYLSGRLEEKEGVKEVECNCTPGQCTCHLHRCGTILSPREERITDETY